MGEGIGEERNEGSECKDEQEREPCGRFEVDGGIVSIFFFEVEE